MDSLQSINVFRHVVETGSFTKAAEVLSVSIAMASKHVRHLENQLQAKLLNRHNRRISLTDAGERYYQACVMALDTLDQARQAARQDTIYPQGVLKLTVPAWCATAYFAGILAAYQRQYPQVGLSLHLESRHVDLVAEGMDLALRVTSQPEPNLIVKPLTMIRFVWVAAPAYLAKHGTPQSVADLAGYDGLLPDYVTINTSLNAVVQSNHTLMLYQLALAGMGVALLPMWVCAQDISSQRLVCLFDHGVQQHTLYAAYMDRTHLSAKVRSFIDFLQAYFARHEPLAPIN